jgi:hypothetical protein
MPIKPFTREEEKDLQRSIDESKEIIKQAIEPLCNSRKVEIHNQLQCLTDCCIMLGRGGLPCDYIDTSREGT